MGAVQRKDYGASANVPANNETLKRVNTQNSPFSVQATGHDKSKDKYIPVTSENVESLETGTRVLQGNREKYVKSITTSGVDPDIVFESAVIAYRDLNTGEEVTQELTKGEILASSSIFLAKVLE